MTRQGSHETRPKQASTLGWPTQGELAADRGVVHMRRLPTRPHSATSPTYLLSFTTARLAAVSGL
jgi:hypothetical protein